MKQGPTTTPIQMEKKEYYALSFVCEIDISET